MNRDVDVVYGYDIEEIDQLADEILTTIRDADAEQKLALVALCRAIVRNAVEGDLDMACLLIDKFAEIDLEPVDTEVGEDEECLDTEIDETGGRGDERGWED